jgi:hypothetical protein
MWAGPVVTSQRPSAATYLAPLIAALALSVRPV